MLTTSKAYQLAKTKVDEAKEQLASILSECEVQVNNSYDLVALKMCLERHEIAPKAVDAVVRHQELICWMVYKMIFLALAEDIVGAIEICMTQTFLKG